MVVRPLCLSAIAFLLGIALPLSSTAQEEIQWDPVRVTKLAAQLHENVKGLRDETRRTQQGAGTGRPRTYYRLMDNLRVIERETRYLHSALESGADRDTTRPTYRRIAMLRRDCAEEMKRQFIGSSSLTRISQAQEIIKQLDPYYGFDPEKDDHKYSIGR